MAKNAYEIEAECINRMIEHFDEEAFFGRSETMTIKDGELDGGEFAHVYFVDWDHVRARRQVNVALTTKTDFVFGC